MEFYGTLGAACAKPETLRALFAAGMTGVRLNLSHTTLTGAAGLLEAFRTAARESGVAPSLLIDLQGAELRIGRLTAPLPLREGKTVTLGAAGVPTPPPVIAAAERGDRISLDDSAILLRVETARDGALVCRVERGGVLQSRKSLALLGKSVALPPLTAEDEENLAHAAACGVTAVMQPFVRSREDTAALRAALARHGLHGVRLMAKIENKDGLHNFKEILTEADEICIARGDLGNALPLWELPRIQKEIARRARAAQKPFCVATQLLWSMQEHSVPTRAEVSDIYNAVLDGAGGLMLTGETAVGKYPVEAMTYLVKTAREAEQFA